MTKNEYFDRAFNLDGRGPCIFIIWNVCERFFTLSLQQNKTYHQNNDSATEIFKLSSSFSLYYNVVTNIAVNNLTQWLVRVSAKRALHFGTRVTIFLTCSFKKSGLLIKSEWRGIIFLVSQMNIHIEGWTIRLFSWWDLITFSSFLEDLSRSPDKNYREVL